WSSDVCSSDLPPPAATSATEIGYAVTMIRGRLRVRVLARPTDTGGKALAWRPLHSIPQAQRTALSRADRELFALLRGSVETWEGFDVLTHVSDCVVSDDALPTIGPLLAATGRARLFDWTRGTLEGFDEAPPFRLSPSRLRFEASLRNDGGAIVLEPRLGIAAAGPAAGEPGDSVHIVQDG